MCDVLVNDSVMVCIVDLGVDVVIGCVYMMYVYAANYVVDDVVCIVCNL